MFKCLKGLAPAYLVAFCTKGSAVSGRSALRSAALGGSCCAWPQDGLGFESLVVAGPSCWNWYVELAWLNTNETIEKFTCVFYTSTLRFADIS